LTGSLSERKSGSIGYDQFGGVMGLFVTDVVAGLFGTLVMDLLNNLIARIGMFLKMDLRITYGRPCLNSAPARFRGDPVTGSEA
jgi:hypothetical protein